MPGIKFHPELVNSITDKYFSFNKFEIFEENNF